jgi:hypothetical protein
VRAGDLLDVCTYGFKPMSRTQRLMPVAIARLGISAVMANLGLAAFLELQKDPTSVAAFCALGFDDHSYNISGILAFLVLTVASKRLMQRLRSANFMLPCVSGDITGARLACTAEKPWLQEAKTFPIRTSKRYSVQGGSS